MVGTLNKLSEILLKDRRVMVGAMSGTSADGVDVILLELDGHGQNIRWRELGKYFKPYTKEIKNAVLTASERGSTRLVCSLNVRVGMYFGMAVKEALEYIGMTTDEVDAIGSHGQTIYHMPELTSDLGIKTRCTLQIGHPSVIAEVTGITTVGDFRVRDIAAGGHGAPIIAYVDWALLSSKATGRLVQNIGGISNVTILPPNPSLDDVKAFDIGPGNMLIDQAVRMLYSGSLEYDPNGEIALSGSVDEKLLNELMEHPFVRKPPPKTAGRREFGSRCLAPILKKALERNLAKEDVIATLAMFTVKSIIYNYDKYILSKYGKIFSEAIVGGGGVRNKFIMRELTKELKMRGINVLTHEDLGIDSKYKEALGMAVLAHETLSGIPNNVVGATGAKKYVIMGVISP